MEKKRWLSIAVILSLLVTIILPGLEVKAETEWQKIDRQLQEIKKEKQEAAKRTRTLDQEIDNIESEQNKLEGEVTKILSKIKETEKKIFALEKEISTVTTEVRVAAEELEQAEERVENRQELLKTRVRLMYRSGSVKYLEVLLGANSFSDFLMRFDALHKIINSDKKILEDNITDRNTIAQKKEEIEKRLAKLEDLHTENERLKLDYLAQKEKHVITIASLDDKQLELNEALKEEEEALKELASKEAELVEKQYNLQFSGGKLAWPVPSSHRVTSDFGLRIHPITGEYKGHTGIDIGHAPGKSSLYGADIIAAADGVVIVASYVSGYGNTVMIDHGGGIWTLYGHIREGGIFVKVGQKVTRGQKIAEVGSTGRSTGPHLHFEVRKNKTPVNPWEYLK